MSESAGWPLCSLREVVDVFSEAWPSHGGTRRRAAPCGLHPEMPLSLLCRSCSRMFFELCPATTPSHRYGAETEEGDYLVRAQPWPHARPAGDLRRVLCA